MIISHCDFFFTFYNFEHFFLSQLFLTVLGLAVRAVWQKNTISDVGASQKQWRHRVKVSDRLMRHTNYIFLRLKIFFFNYLVVFLLSNNKFGYLTNTRCSQMSRVFNSGLKGKINLRYQRLFHPFHQNKQVCKNSVLIHYFRDVTSKWSTKRPNNSWKCKILNFWWSRWSVWCSERFLEINVILRLINFNFVRSFSL